MGAGTPRVKLQQVQGLRGLAILAIALSHCQLIRLADGTNAVGIWGGLGVELFILMSGFLSCWWHFEQEQEPFSWHGSWAIIRRKLGKYYPLHLVTLLVAVPLAFRALIEGRISAYAELVLNALLLQDWLPVGYFSYNGVAWFLSLMVFLVVVTPRMIAWLQRRTVQQVAWMMAGILAFQWLWSFAAMHLPAHHWLVYILPVVRSLDLALGGGTYVLYRWISQQRPQSRMVWQAVAGGVLIVFGLVTLVGAGSQHEVYSVAAWALPSVAFLLAVVSLGERSTGVAVVWHNPVMVWLGNISFELFLVHQLVIRYAEAVSKHLALDVPAVVLYPGALLLACALADGIHRYRLRRHS